MAQGAGRASYRLTAANITPEGRTPPELKIFRGVRFDTLTMCFVLGRVFDYLWPQRRT